MANALVEAAIFERDRRASRYPAIIADNPAKAEELSVDYQCWVAISEWLATDRFAGFHGGAAPEHDDAPYISWSYLETAAQKALAAISAKIESQPSFPRRGGDGDREGPTPEGLGELRRRRSCLFAIHHKVQLRRQSIDTLNRALRGGREQAAA